MSENHESGKLKLINFTIFVRVVSEIYFVRTDCKNTILILPHTSLDTFASLITVLKLRYFSLCRQGQ